MNTHNQIIKILMITVFTLITVVANGVRAMDDTELNNILQGLLDRSFDVKSEAVNRLSTQSDERINEILTALLEGDLYYRKSDKRFVYIEKIDKEVELTDILNKEKLGQVKKRKVKKVGINNALRGQIRTILATLTLYNADSEVRLSAINNIIKELTPENERLLREALEKENDSEVQQQIQLALSLIELSADDPAVRLAAVNRLQGNINPQVKNYLNSQLAVEEDNDIKTRIQKALDTIEDRLKFYNFIQTLFFGLSLGSVLVLAAIGLAITFGVMGVINMAHGELIMLGAYTTFVVQQAMPGLIDYSLFVAIPLAFIVSGVVGIAIQQGVIRFLQGRPLETLLATFGISLVLQQAVRSIFSPLNRSVSTPSWMSGTWEINEVLSLTLNRLYIVVFTVLVLLLLMAILKKTALGLQVRAVSQNRNMARAMGIRSSWVDAMTFGLGSGIAGIAGVALSQLTNVGPNLGQAYIVDSFMVVVFGGVGNLWGTFLAGEILGIINKFLEPHAGAVLAKILILIFIILFIQRRPSGLFPQKGRAAEA